MEIIVKYNKCIRISNMIEFYEKNMDRKYIFENIYIRGNE